MPLPENTTISLHNHSRPGDALHSKPKQAMFLRLSAETLEALQASPAPQVHFTFGKRPCIQVGDTFFPTQPSPENAVHDIYLRATSARQKNPPLKYYAKVVGKFVVHRDRLDEVGDKIGRTRKDAEELRQQRKIQMIDEPPADVLNAGKRKDAKPKRPAPTPTIKRPTPTPSSNNPSPGIPTPSLGSDFRSRLIQCLLASPRTTEECIKLLLGRNPNPDTRKEFLKMLIEVADKPPSKKNADAPASQVWTLKTQFRAETRSRLTTGEVERVSMTRNTTPTHTEGRPSPMPAPEVKKPAMPRKEKKQKKADTPILAKDESSGSSSNTVREAVASSTKTAPSPLPPPVRRLPPGSGYKARAPSPSIPSPTTATIPQKRPHLNDATERREQSRLASSSRPSPSPAQLPSRPSPAPSITKQMAGSQNTRGDGPPVKRKRLEEDPPTETLHTARIPKKRKADDEPRVSSRDQSAVYEDGELPESPVPKKRPKLEDNPIPREGNRERERERERPRNRERELKTLPPKPTRAHEPSPSPRKSQQSSTPSTQHSRDSSERPATAVMGTSKSNSGKFKRGSSIYTTSDDEMPLKKQTQAPQPKASANVPPQHKKKRDPQPRPPLPSDPAGIRAVYRERYVPYITTYGKVVAQKAKLEEALSGSVSSDMDLMEEDEVTKLANELRLYQRELEVIEAAYKKAGGRGKLEPERMGRSSSSD
ncbi:hypothetical protein BJ322DRAFT_1030236 [Thelephora terrestris]|uniref:RNA polymerase II elongation factor ELL N-terminal domain-containing protein n=1 Tax=Thelephora terrestris TaxID=56493 RepID=A0A9P6HUM9_9AGAM|nr:hypothetical protein BJ322DRAFT_1030236 [Thelephora terrestris]